MFLNSAWNLLIWKYLRVGVDWMCGHLLHDQPFDKTGCLCGTLLDDKHHGILSTTILLPGHRLAFLRLAQPIRDRLLFYDHSVVDNHSDALLRKQPRHERPEVSYSIPNIPFLLHLPFPCDFLKGIGNPKNEHSLIINVLIINFH